MKRCDPNARARCPDGKTCELNAEFADGSRCDIFNESTLKQPMTNADRIRAMSNENLAKVFTDAVADGCPPRMDWACAKDENGWDACDACWCKWLQQPAEEVP